PDTATMFLVGDNYNFPIEGKYYNFDEKGALQRSAWKGSQYSDGSGVFVEEGLQEINGKIYYFTSYTPQTNKIRLVDEDITLYFSKEGALERATSYNGYPLNKVTNISFKGKTLIFEKDGSLRKNLSL
ncbi:cell wall-binding protein, partial [Bacillus thuringiensis]|nr:cell wall-binding protein [Bacillus thuringiensis]